MSVKTGTIGLPDGSQPFMWGFALAGGAMQYPGPTLIVTQGTTVTVTLTNTLDTSVSIIFPGQPGVAAKKVKGAAAQGVLTLEAGPGGVVQYSFNATEPGTYLYHSGTRPDLQIEMGLVGGLIVRPVAGGAVQSGRAYQSADSAFDVETLFLLTEMDPRIHELARAGKTKQIDTTGYNPQAWFINGRCGPDTLREAGDNGLPNQPYDCRPEMEPGMRLLLRVASPGRDLHPFCVDGNSARVIARDGRLIGSAAPSGFTIQTIPGGTVDAIFTWTGQGLGWDVFGHAASDPKYPFESDTDHGKSFPVQLPNANDTVAGGYYSGSPYLGRVGALPPGQGGQNLSGVLSFLWHSGLEKETTNFGVYPGGMMTRLMVKIKK